jgi:hypothetical protein
MALAGQGADNRMSAETHYQIFAENEPGAYGHALFTQENLVYGSADWTVNAAPDDNPWIESKIKMIVDAAPGSGQPGEIQLHAHSEADVTIADTHITATTDEDGLVHVAGTLMDLDGPHTISIDTINSVVILTARRYVKNFSAYVDTSGIGEVTANQSDGFFGEGLDGDMLALATLRAFVGTPSTLLGDFNLDGVVDAQDYVTWRYSVGQPYLPNSNGLGTVGPAHYDLWRANFGNSAGSGSAILGTNIPEPRAIILFFVGLAGLAVSTRSRHVG